MREGIRVTTRYVVHGKVQRSVNVFQCLEQVLPFEHVQLLGGDSRDGTRIAFLRLLEDTGHHDVLQLLGIALQDHVHVGIGCQHLRLHTDVGDLHLIVCSERETRDFKPSVNVGCRTEGRLLVVRSQQAYGSTDDGQSVVLGDNRTVDAVGLLCLAVGLRLADNHRVVHNLVRQSRALQHFVEHFFEPLVLQGTGHRLHPLQNLLLIDKLVVCFLPQVRKHLFNGCILIHRVDVLRRNRDTQDTQQN